ncbi:related to zinc finger protein [Rhynchosporium agropyri]|uniref:Related to zinc finger protein n=1 Tax=Rhynchosporium agropyri TaxID=914238 RepID=A0A1E1KY29_9HELO|nr:related to zinc finger protein [Rhynchosporium agropyri]
MNARSARGNLVPNSRFISIARAQLDMHIVYRAGHQHSRTHVGSGMQCPFCKKSFATASGVTIHLESGSCSGCDLDRQKINNMVQRMDTNNVITRPMLTMPGYDNNVQDIATERSWNGRAYACYLCRRQFGTLRGLNAHINSPVHEQSIYRCPGRGCGRDYKILSGLVQHVESESCGLMRFAQVQQQARNGVQSFVGRMISN